MDYLSQDSKWARRIKYILLIALLFSLLRVSNASAEENCIQLLTTRCETCHYLTRVCQKVETEMSKKYWFGGPEGTWKRTIKNMVKQGAVLTAKEEDILVECLSKPTPELLGVCKLKK